MTEGDSMGGENIFTGVPSTNQPLFKTTSVVPSQSPWPVFKEFSESKGIELVNTDSIDQFSSFQIGELIALNNAFQVANALEKYSTSLKSWLIKHQNLKVSHDRKGREEFVLVNKTPIRKNDFDADESQVKSIQDVKK